MSPSTAATAFFKAGLAVLLLVMLSLSSCDEEPPTQCDLYAVGAVEGYVLAGGEGVSVEIFARAIENMRPQGVVSETVSDSTGWYRLELPVGLYRLEADPSMTRLSNSDMRDTVRVGPRVHRYDLLRGRVEIDVLLPEELNGRTFDIYLDQEDIGRAARDTKKTLDGRLSFVLPAVPPGRFAMELRYGGLKGELYLPGTPDGHLADSLTVGTESVASYTADLSSQYASVSGHVTGSWQKAARGAMNVQAYSSWMEPVASASCTSDGAFTLDLFLPQRVRLMTSHDGVTQWVGGETFQTAQAFDVQPGDRITGISEVESGLEIWLQGPGDRIFHEYSLLIRDKLGNETEILYPFGNSWSYMVCNLRPGKPYFVRVDGLCNDQPWARQWYDGAETPEDATPIELGDGELREIVFDLVEGGRIAGELLTPSGTPPDVAFCGLHDAAGEPFCRSPSGFYRGVFEFRGLPDGEYYLSAHANYANQYGNTWWYPGTFNFEDAVAIPIVDHAAVTGVVWSLPPNAAEVVP